MWSFGQRFAAIRLSITWTLPLFLSTIFFNSPSLVQLAINRLTEAFLTGSRFISDDLVEHTDLVVGKSHRFERWKIWHQRCEMLV